ncbi:Aldehyde oxidase and xanthine dehydrogenase, molybdopterin binding protein [Candidatus Sulfotelmatobacter kueseliae]|uniref:Aldehyde oxidase and xanthine dehydrogenase, molybdopterin binding protein n=1 Tax=Candidatus Sulfotelmatobacter kueseliae TaxID=2042962 RepID=A0A2U3KB66_9BACT|nr:Aldehyde oxidase and xanthine dehydrogenase, molybdopterin binding protein [Candidatus Sulfotelmatobacter kueseliae]
MSPLSRREFVAIGAAAGAGLVIGFYLPHDAGSKRDSFSPNAYLRITPDNKVTIVVARSEMGQGVRTALPMILAEELEADWKQIEIEQAGASTLFGDQTTGGSASIHTCWDPMRKAGAAAREMLISAAALTWGVPRSACTAENGRIQHATSSRSASYGELAGQAATLPVPTDPPLKQSKDYKLVGQRLPRLDSPAKVKGEAVFGIDVRVPGMKLAVLSRCPTIGGKVSGFDDKDSKKISGVSYVGKVGESAVAVVAGSVWAAMEGRRVLNVTWDDGPNKNLNTATVITSLRQAASRKAASIYLAGDPAKTSGRHISAEYELPFMAHAPMEPGNCTAHYQGTKCELWAPTQVPQDCRDAVAQAVGLDPDQVKVNVTLMGGGFGRRLEHDYAVEAALVSKAIRAPVKVLWTREDDMRFSTYRPASFHQLSATLDGSGFPIALTHRIVAPSISGQRGQPGPNNLDPDLPDEAGPVYGISNYSIEYVMIETPVPLGWMRSVYALQAAFALESFIDELAVAAGKDPLEYRLHLLAKDQDLQFFTTTWHTARMRGVLQTIAEKAGWDKPLPAGRYRGAACFGCFDSYMAEVVEISMENGQPRVHRVVAVVDCGQVVNPSILEQQIQGGIVYALANALRARITIKNGGVVEGNFDDYAPLRMEETPAVEVYAVPSAEAPTGIGEPSVPPLAPALCNAIYAATKKRIRALPVLS